MLDPGLQWLEQKTGKPVFGVLPYLTNFYLDAEDAINSQQVLDNKSKDCIRIVVPVFPRISNHTDFDALRLHPNVELLFAAPNQPLPKADLIILPGSKNVRADMKTLYKQGWDKDIYKHLRYDGKLLGICGGYQMLGNNIDDPDGIEDIAGSCSGLGLFDINTTLAPHKQLKQVKGTIYLPNNSSAACCGYEIHCGITDSDETTPFVKLNDGRQDGAISHDGQIAGTYLHGLFDHTEATNVILNWAGLNSNNAINLNQLREQQLDRLADCMEQHLSEELFELVYGETTCV